MQASTPNSGLLDTSDIKSVLRIVSKNWWIVVSFVTVFYLSGYIYAYKLPDIYASSTKLLLQSNDKYNTKSVINSSLDNYGYQSYIGNSNEISVISSYDLLKKVVDKLNVNVSYFIKGRLVTKEFYTGIPFKVDVAFINPTFYEQDISFKIIDQTHYRISYVEDKVIHTQDGTFGLDLVNTSMKVKISANGTLNTAYVNALKETDYFFKIHNPNNLVYQFKGSLSVNNLSMSNVLEISLNDNIPARAIAFLDTLSRLYIENTLNSQFEINSNTIHYIDIQLDEITDILNNIEDTLQQYKESKRILNLDREEQEYFSQFSGYDHEKAGIELQLGALNDLEQYIIQDKDSAFLPPSIYMINDAFLKSGAEELYKMQIAINSGLNSVTRENESVLNVKKRIKLLKEDLLTYISNTRTALNEQINNVNEQLGKYIDHIKTIPAKQRGLLNIQRRQDINEKLYEFLLQQRATTVIEKAAIIPETKVIETARLIGQVEPKRSKIYYTFMGIGAIISLFIIFFRVTFYDRIDNIQELKLKTTLPILGEILSAPLVTDISIAVEDNPKSPLTESFRTLRTNLQYMAVDTLSKVILFTSNGPSEGKTFCSINMSAILAKADKKVLLLEFDMHKPRIYKALGISSNIGLSSIIIGKSEIEECIKHTAIVGMDVILCGPVPPNSSELILSEKIKDILNFGKENYDYVIVDTPPLGLISDAFILMRLADINLFVLNTRFAYKDAISYVQETVQVNKIKNFGFVLNNVKRKKSKYYYNRYNYGYYGGYGYGGYGGYGSYGA